MTERIIIAVLSVLLVFSWRGRLLSYAKKLIKKCVPAKYVKTLKKHFSSMQSPVKKDIIPAYPLMTQEQAQTLDNSLKLTFTGDLILLKDMVENAFDSHSGQYSFDSMFEYVKDVYNNADFNIGVFEGPVAGEERGYSTSCFNDGIPIYLNFPKEYAQAVKRAGFDLVTLANNHMLDQGIDGMYNTLNELDDIGLPHIGAYRNEQEKSNITITNIKGKKVVFLAYTFGSNHYDSDFFYLSENKHLSRIIVSPQNKHIKEALKLVKEDFEEAKKLLPDLIVVLPHMGKQFRHAPDDFQKYWCRVFVENGADIILSDHPHAVQPIEWISLSGRHVLVVHCPGNFINSYIKHDGDASMIVEGYLNPETGKPFAAACIPIYAYSKYGRNKKENYKGIPIYKLIKDEHICPELSRYEFARVKEVHQLVTKTALGVEIGLDDIQEKYFTFADSGFVRHKTDA